MELVQTPALLPSRAQRVRTLTPVEYGVEMGTAEQSEHCQIRLAVSAVCGGVDQHQAAGCPHDVAA
jgi:hypothetical protein